MHSRIACSRAGSRRSALADSTNNDATIRELRVRVAISVFKVLLHRGSRGVTFCGDIGASSRLGSCQALQRVRT
jgi:hypothetical protein